MQGMQRFLKVYPQRYQVVLLKYPQVVILCKTCQYMLWIIKSCVENYPQRDKRNGFERIILKRED